MHKLLFLQGISAISTFLRFTLIIELFGMAVLGEYSYALSIIMMITFLSQVVINGGVQSELIKSNEGTLDKVVTTLFPIVSIYAVIATVVLFLVVGLFSINILLAPIVISSCFVLFNSIFDLYFLVTNRLFIYYGALAVSSVISLLSVAVIKYAGFSYGIEILPIITYATVSLVYLLVFRLKEYKIKFDIDWFYCLSLYKKYWHLNLIPLVSTLIDLVVKSFFVTYSSTRALGIYQMILSFEALIGNVIVGPILRVKLIAYSKSKITHLSTVVRDSAKLIAVVVVALIFSMLVFKVALALNIQLDSIDLIPIAAAAGLCRFTWYIWGIVGQLAIANNLSVLVTYVELSMRPLLALILSFCIYMELGDLSYIYSLLFVSVPLIFMILKVINKVYKNGK